ncbi:hypothetical protein BofuT4_uP131810.1 [Botrytis cinerea T4]|uniref:Uncharacterized protein n=1 Tax=Botryotinia fuckeliana (strain T4) TaxID=999810 RepID=G2YQV3_BOTF4|nr:hypothetical protein BofuT4_uP131810.1 [Botrytis cinerea T4]
MYSTHSMLSSMILLKVIPRSYRASITSPRIVQMARVETDG